MSKYKQTITVEKTKDPVAFKMNYSPVHDRFNSYRVGEIRTSHPHYTTSKNETKFYDEVYLDRKVIAVIDKERGTYVREDFSKPWKPFTDYYYQTPNKKKIDATDLDGVIDYFVESRGWVINDRKGLEEKVFAYNEAITCQNAAKFNKNTKAKKKVSS